MPSDPDSWSDAGVDPLARFVHLLPLGVIDFATDGRITNINPAAAHLLGDLVGTGRRVNVFDMFRASWPDLSSLVAGYDHSTGVVVADHRLDASTDDRRLALSVTLTRVATDRQMMTIADVTDITTIERLERLERELHLSEERFRSLSDQSPLIVWVHDAVGAQEWVNETYCNYFGVTREDMRGDRWKILTHPDDGSAYLDEFLRCVKEHEPFHGEVRVMDGSARWRWMESWGTPRFDPHGNYVGHVGTSADVTDRRRAERALAQEAAFTQRVLDNLFTFAGVLELDGTVISANQAPLEAADIALDEVMGRPFWDCYWWSYSERVADQLRRAVKQAAGGSVVRYDVDVRIRDDGRLPIDFQIAPLRDDEGEVTHLVVSGLDLTDRIEAQTRVESAHWLAESLGRIAARLSTAVTVADVANVAVESVADMGAAVFDRVDGDRLVPIAVAGIVGGTVPEDGPLARIGDQVAIRAASDNATTSVPDALAFHRLYPTIDSEATEPGVEARLSTPCRSAEGEVLGVLSTFAPEPNAFDEDQVGFVETVAALTGGALERALLHERAEVARAAEASARQRSETIAGVLTEIERVETVAEQVRVLAAQLVPGFADFVTVEVPGDEASLLALVHSDATQEETLLALRQRHRLGPDDPNSMWTIAEGHRLLIAEITDEMRREHVEDDEGLRLLDRLGERSIVAAPIDLGSNRRGAILCGISDPERSLYDEDDLEFLDEIATRSGLIIAAANARQREHAASLRLQKALLPEQLAAHPEIEIAALYDSATAQLEVGGDWYDTFSWSEHTYGVVVGDIVGHDIEAAAAMGRVRAVSNALITESEPDPSTMLAILDRVARGPQGTTFATALCIVVRTDIGELSYASAGHPPALLLGGTTEPVWLDQAQSPPLSSMRVDHRPSATHRVEPDDIVILYTDGLIERRGEQLGRGLHRLVEQASPLLDRDVSDVNETLASSMRSPTEQDDTVIVTLRYASTRPRLGITITAEAGELARMRRELRTWLANQGVTEKGCHEILLGVGEAAANAVEHAYVTTTGQDVRIQASIRDQTLTLFIKDAGIWQPPVTVATHRGRGSRIMAAVADTFDRTTDASGTTVKLSFDLTRLGIVP